MYMFLYKHSFPFLVLENHYAQLGVYYIEKFLNNLIRAVSGEKLMAPEKIEKYYIDHNQNPEAVQDHDHKLF